MALGRDCKGFTLIEILMALVILTVGFLGTIGLLAVTIDKNRLAGQITEATTLAQNKIEGLHNSSSIVSVTESLNADGSAGNKYTRATTVLANSGWYSVVVQVAWARGGKPYSITTRTIIAN